jgi:hypothetical protein
VTPRTTALLVLALVLLGYTGAGLMVGRFEDGKNKVMRADDPLAFRLRAALLLSLAMALVLMAGGVVGLRAVLAGGGVALLACSAIAVARGRSVFYRGTPWQRDREPVGFWLHVAVSVAAGALALGLALGKP